MIRGLGARGADDGGRVAASGGPAAGLQAARKSVKTRKQAARRLRLIPLPPQWERLGEGTCCLRSAGSLECSKSSSDANNLTCSIVVVAFTPPPELGEGQGWGPFTARTAPSGCPPGSCEQRRAASSCPARRRARP